MGGSVTEGTGFYRRDHREGQLLFTAETAETAEEAAQLESGGTATATDDDWKGTTAERNGNIEGRLSLHPALVLSAATRSRS